MTFISFLSWVAIILLILLVFLFLDPRHLPSFLQRTQRGIVDDLSRMLNSSPVFETTKSLLEASLFAGPTYYGIVEWMSAQPSIHTMRVSSDDALQILGGLACSLVGIYLCSHRLDVLSRTSGSGPDRP